MASFYIPMSLSYASNLGHIPPINGLYSFVFNPIIYAFLGTCPQMVVGPEAAGSLLVGQVVRSSVDSGDSGDHDAVMNAQIAGVVTGMAGAVIFIAGLTRLGFLDSVLSRPFLRGFISAIGFVILVDQLIPELGLSTFEHRQHIDHGSSATKIAFLFGNLEKAHRLTAAVSIGSFVIIMIFRCRLLNLDAGVQADIVSALSKSVCSLDIRASHIFLTVFSLLLFQRCLHGNSSGTRKDLKSLDTSSQVEVMPFRFTGPSNFRTLSISTPLWVLRSSSRFLDSSNRPWLRKVLEKGHPS